METAFDAFADMLQYPWTKPTAAVAACEASVAPISEAAVALLRAFGTFVERTPVERLQEIYSSVFELDPSCPPYVGYHVFGETYQRSAFLVGLAGRCRDVGLEPQGELADHLTVVLRFLARTPDEVERTELITEALLPALARMVGKARKQKGPYGDVLAALELVLQQHVWPGPDAPPTRATMADA